MAALALSAALFAFWGLVGCALITGLGVRPRMLQSLLLAPALGMSATLVAIFLLNCAGMPVGTLVPGLTGALVLGSVGLLVWFRPGWHLWAYLPFASVFLLTLVLSGWPMLWLGFDWLGYCNEDMANYCLNAQRVRFNGYYTPPNEDTLFSGRDYGQNLWCFFVVFSTRSGVEMLLAWATGLTGLTEHEAFMPVTLAFHLVLVSAAGGMIATRPTYHRAALAACTVLATSPLLTLGVLNQLLGQVPGIALLCVTAALLLRPARGRMWPLVRHGALAGLALLALLLAYPEILPFLVVAYGGYHLVGLIRGRERLQPHCLTLVSASGVVFLLLNSYSLDVYVYLRHQLGHGGGTATNAVFPQYLTPSGLAYLWGLRVIGETPVVAWQWTALVLGAVLLATVACFALALTWRLQAVGPLLGVMLGVSSILLARQAGFGLYKLAMFVQPFLLGTLVTVWWAAVRRPLLRVLPLAVLALLTGYAQACYVGLSLRQPAAFAYRADGSSNRVNAEFRDHVHAAGGAPLLLDSACPLRRKYQALYTRGTPAHFFSATYFDESILGLSPEAVLHWRPEIAAAACRLARRSQSARRTHAFRLQDESEPEGALRFRPSIFGREVEDQASAVLITETGRLSILNRRTYSPDCVRSFIACPLRECRNHLVFIPSVWGKRESWPPILSPLTCPLEDRFLAGRTLACLERRHLFRVLNPTSAVRLVLELATNLTKENAGQLPAVEAIGRDRQPFVVAGQGSARLISPPLQPQEIDGGYYVALDLGENPGGVSARARNISLISDEEYLRLAPPESLRSFPKDLLHPDLEYCGIGEDGWLGEQARACLGTPTGPHHLEVSGCVPAVTAGRRNAPVEMTVSLDGQELGKQSLTPGNFSLRLPVPSGSRRRDLKLSFSPVPRFVGSRPLSCRLSRWGFAEGAIPEPPSIIHAVPDERARRSFEHVGVGEAGEVRHQATCWLTAPETIHHLVARGTVPGRREPSPVCFEMSLSIEGQTVLRERLCPGEFEVRAEVPSTSGRQRVDVQFQVVELPSGVRKSPPAGPVRLQVLGFEPGRLPGPRP